MKGTLKGLIVGLILGASIASTAALATNGAIQKELLYHNIKITLNEKEIVPTDVNGTYVEPFTIDGTTFLPVRAIASALGLNVEWDEATNTVKLSGEKSKNEQAIEKVKELAEIYATVSPNMVKEILINDFGFTDTQATYALRHSGIDWNWYAEIHALDFIAVSNADGEKVTAFDVDVYLTTKLGYHVDEASYALSSAEVINRLNNQKVLPSDTTDFSQMTEKQTEVTVYTETELLNAIGNNKKIILASDYYNLSNAEDTDNPFVEKQLDWSLNPTGAYVIKNVVNMTIEGNAEIVTDDIYADVLSFENCGNITLRALTVGHTEYFDEYRCEGAVTRFKNCDNINIKDCNLYGCGAIGVATSDSSNINIKNCNIYDCSYSGVWFTKSEGIKVSGTNFYSSNYYGGVCRIDNSKAEFADCSVYDNICTDCEGFITTFDSNGEPSEIVWSDSVFYNNRFKAITNEETTTLTFIDCTFKNNSGSLENPSVIYNNCDIR